MDDDWKRCIVNAPRVLNRLSMFCRNGGALLVEQDHVCHRSPVADHGCHRCPGRDTESPPSQPQSAPTHMMADKASDWNRSKIVASVSGIDCRCDSAHVWGSQGNTTLCHHLWGRPALPAWVPSRCSSSLEDMTNCLCVIVLGSACARGQARRHACMCLLVFVCPCWLCVVPNLIQHISSVTRLSGYFLQTE